ncbi:MAG: hypothetical protein JNN33_15245 [Rhodospirillaceae bacterium]|jgi:hypothetical protein|nr:hypothetical protein [Rhodospirillaceae bacterium]
MLDVILRIAALAAFVASLAVLVIFVPEPDLVVVLLLVAAMAIYDFLLRPILANRRRRG